MSFGDICIVLSFLVIVAVITRMLRAIRVLDARVSLLQEQIDHTHEATRRPASTASSRAPVGERADGVARARTLTPVAVHVDGGHPRSLTPVAVHGDGPGRARSLTPVAVHADGVGAVRTPVPPSHAVAPGEPATPGAATTHVIEDAEAEAAWAAMAAEQERLKRAMGRDFQVRPGRSAAGIRGKVLGVSPDPKPVARKPDDLKGGERVLSARDLAAKLERK